MCLCALTLMVATTHEPGAFAKVPGNDISLASPELGTLESS